MKQLRIFYSILFIFCSVLGFSKGIEEHTKDMRDVFPFAGKVPALEKLFYMVNDYLDRKDFDNRLYRGNNTGHPVCIVKLIEQDPRFKRMTLKEHRIWFHWGFNADIKLFQPLKKMINENIAKGQIKAEDAPYFYYVLNQERAKRNRELMNLAGKVLGYSKFQGYVSKAMRDQQNGLVTILYSIHVLGDHTTSSRDWLAKTNVIYKDIHDAIFNIAGRDFHDYQLAKKLVKTLTAVSRKPDTKETVELYLQTLKDNFPRFILSLEAPLYNYRKRFEKMNYPLKHV